jgi:hypothetical protein
MGSGRGDVGGEEFEEGEGAVVEGGGDEDGRRGGVV